MPKAKKRTIVNKKYPCPVCAIVLSSPYNLKIHTETKCSTEKRFICEVKLFLFSNHSITKYFTQISYQVCNSRFLTQHSLKTHLNSLHFGEKKFECVWCSKKFLSKGQLKVHERSHTKEKSFICGVCNKGFSHRESLVTHSTTHSGIKPYLCECCNATFSCVGNLIKHRKVRPNSCGRPIYSNQKICKRAGVKCKGKEPKIIVKSAEGDSLETEKTDEEHVVEEVVYEMQVVDIPEMSQNHMTDHQYISFDNSQTHDVHLEDYAKKEMDVFDYIGIEIKNIQEQEEREKQLQLQNGTKEEDQTPDLLNEPDFYIDSSDIIDDDTADEVQTTFFIDDVIFSIKDEFSEEFANYVEVDNDSSFHCKLCPRIYQKQNITVKHLKTEHQIVLRHYNYDNSNRYRKPQKDPNWKCQYCAKKYTSKRLVERHQKIHGPLGDLIYKCSCCRLYFQTIAEMEAHQSAEHEDRLMCKVEGCDKKFDLPEKLISHANYAHSNRKSSLKKYNFVCQLCGEF